MLGKSESAPFDGPKSKGAPLARKGWPTQARGSIVGAIRVPLADLDCVIMDR